VDGCTLAREFAHGADGFLFDVGGLHTHLRRAKDWRGRQGQLYMLIINLVAPVLANMACEDTPSGIAMWVRERLALFHDFCGVQRLVMPSHHTDYAAHPAEALKRLLAPPA
jgi:hypothetical protein